ncbi:MAG TPA: BTAD domain-containing putative transcriptional regulator [Motilibacteraceae bacterium]|nr:BTAD domain-containing putative transcriptional regulator [Motilibacteraceae bacterium]
MIVRVLGGVSLLAPDGAAVPLSGDRQPALLAALAARAGQVVSVDRLVDLLWTDSPPANPSAALHSAVFKLRVNLARVVDREVLLTRDHGYLLDLRPGDLDAEVFASLVHEARDLAPPQAAEALDRALRLWRGPAYGGFADGELARLEAIRLEELRLVAVERLGAALLAAARPADAVALLQPFVVEQPLREAARITLMQALHAQGRTAEALEQYQTHRTHLADELGLEPSRALAEVQLALLQSPAGQDGSPSASTASGGGLSGMAVRYLRTEAGNVLACGSVGTGPKVVVLLGWVSSLDVIASGRDPRSSLLERLTGELALTLYDRAGTGLSPGPVADYGLEASVAELADVVREVGPPVSLFAMSSSGPVALTLAHRKPEWFESLAFFGTFANGPATFTDERMYAMTVEIARTHWGIGSKMLADLYRPGLSDEAAWHLARVFRDSSSAEVAAGYLEHMRPQDVSALLPEIRTPALVLHYRSDRLIPFRGGQDIAAGLPHATFLPLDGPFHLPDVGALETIEQALVSHVRTHASGGRLDGSGKKRPVSGGRR